ncbi:MAG: hypothetical protein JWM52_280 [Candidatus Saccharibacteria bacterium]|nr:hypothetical protein [Candidatus Saccharibacteria bacterium]
MKTRTNILNGFTIIELLIVIVIIGILASITIISYTGVTQRTNTSNAAAAAQSVAQKVIVYNSETGTYPYAGSDLSIDSTKPYYLAPTVATYTLSSTQPSTPNDVKYVKCGTTPNSAQTDITLANHNITGIRLYYWTYNGTPNANSYIAAGNDSGAGVVCP